MEFIDHTGHIFTQKSYDDYPIGYEFETVRFYADNCSPADSQG